MGCSNDSDDNSALLLALSSKNSSSASLPASVGENELAGKKFKMAFSDYSIILESAVNVAKIGVRESVDSDYNYTDVGAPLFTLNKTESDDKAVYELIMDVNGSPVSYGSFTIKYATSNNIPDFTSEPEYHLVVELFPCETKSLT